MPTAQAEQAEQANEQAGRDAAREVIRAFADELTGRGLDVRGPEWDGSQFLKVTNVPGVLCDLAVRDDGAVAWECHVCPADEADPARLVQMVLALLDVGTVPPGGVARSRRSLTVKGAAGRALAGLGLRVGLEVLYSDDSCYEVCSAIAVADPARPCRGEVQVADDGLIRWECRVGEPSGERPGMSPAHIAEAIARALVA